MTRCVIDGKVYDTETATEIGKIGSITDDIGNFKFWAATLYVTRKGRFFMEGEGGPQSPFAESLGGRAYASGSGLRALEPQEALAMASYTLSTGTIERHFGDLIEEA